MNYINMKFLGIKETLGCWEFLVTDPRRSESSGVLRVCRKRWDKKSSSKCCLSYQQLYMQPELSVREGQQLFPLSLRIDCLNTFDGLSDHSFLLQLCYSWEVAQRRLFNCLCGRRHLATRQRKTDFFRRCLILKVQLFCHTFLSVSQGGKVFGSNNCGACKSHGSQPFVSDDRSLVSVGRSSSIYNGTGLIYTAEDKTQYVLNLEFTMRTLNTALWLKPLLCFSTVYDATSMSCGNGN